MSISSLKSNWRNIALGCSGSLVLSAVCIWLILYTFFGPNPFNDQPVDKEVWFSHADNYDVNNPRGHMAEDAQRQIRKGMTREQVIRILGKPDSNDSPIYSSITSATGATGSWIWTPWILDLIALAV